MLLFPGAKYRVGEWRDCHLYSTKRYDYNKQTSKKLNKTLCFFLSRFGWNDENKWRSIANSMILITVEVEGNKKVGNEKTWCNKYNIINNNCSVLRQNESIISMWQKLILKWRYRNYICIQIKWLNNCLTKCVLTLIIVRDTRKKFNSRIMPGWQRKECFFCWSLW